MVSDGPEPPPPFRLPRSWPRLYLDTGDLMAIADGTVDRRDLDDLCEACEGHAVVLVISAEHVQDMPLDPDTADRLATALERFKLRGFVTKSPTDVEPWPERDTPIDVQIDGVANIREVITYGLTSAKLATMRAVQDALHEGTVNAVAAARESAPVTLPRRHRAIDLQATITQMRGWLGPDPAAIVEHHAEADGGTMTAGERAAIVERHRPLAEFLTSLEPALETLGLDRTELVRRAAYSMSYDGYHFAPGAWLGGQLAAGLVRNTQRDPLRSDSVDSLHAMHFPYVDIASCDRQSYAILAPLVAEARGSRPTVKLFRNGNLRDIVQHIRSLPLGHELPLD